MEPTRQRRATTVANELFALPPRPAAPAEGRSLPLEIERPGRNTGHVEDLEATLSSASKRESAHQ
jgi:hypothetical protein